MKTETHNYNILNGSTGNTYMSNSSLDDNLNYQSYRRLPSPNSLNNSFNPNPYGVTFENVKDYRKNEQNRYREDLDYLIWLKQNRQNQVNEQKAKEYWELNMSKEKQRQQYEKNSLESKQQQQYLLNIQKNLINENDMKRMNEKNMERTNDLKNLDYLEQLYKTNDKSREKKEHWSRVADEELNRFNKQKYDKLREKYEEDQDNMKKLNEKNNLDLKAQDDYKKKFEDINKGIYKNLMNYSGYLSNNNIRGNNEPYHLMNDLELNKYIADQKDRDRIELKKNLEGNELFNSMKQKMAEEDMNNKIKKIGSQKAYKDFLDKQYLDLKSSRHQHSEPFVGDLLPSYKYPSLPVPLYKKAKDSIHLVKNNLLFENQGKDMNDFFKKDVQNHTLLDQHNNRDSYLGQGSSLQHNPITNPIEISSNTNKYLKNSLLFSKDNSKFINKPNKYSFNNSIGNHYPSNYENQKEPSNINYKNNNIVEYQTSNNINNNYNNNNNSNFNSNINNNINNQFSNYQSNNEEKNEIPYMNDPNLTKKRVRTPHNNLNYSEANDEITPNYYYNPENYNQNINNYHQNSNINNIQNKDTTNERLYSTNLPNNYKLMSTSKESSILKKFRDRLKVKGVNGIYKLRKYFENNDKSKTYLIDFAQFNSTLKEFYMGYNYEDSRSFFQYLDDSKSGKIRYEEFLSAIIGEMSEDRKKAVVDLYTKLSQVFQDKFIDEGCIKGNFDPSCHPEVLSNRKSMNDVLVEFMNDFNLFFHNSRVSIKK